MINARRGSFSLALLAGASAIAITVASPAFAEEQTRAFDIPAQPLSSALMAYSQQTDTPVIARMELLEGKRAPAVRGDMTGEVALGQLLQGTGLRAVQGAAGGLLVERTDQGPQGGSAAGDGADTGAVDALIVTAQKREEAIQDVPIAISAFTQKDLEAQKIEGGFDLLKAIPNVTFSKNNFSGYNFSIRGIGTKAISVTTDPGVAVSFNNVTMIRNRLFEQEYFDIERVEVLRGPQGTLYGRNATSGVINVITAKPDMDEFKGSIKGEVGNYNARRTVVMANVPLVENVLALRLAGAMTQRDGYGVNLYDGRPADGRDLWSARATLAFEPTERIRANLVWERFEEDDNRSRTSKQLCTRDPGPDEIGGVALPPIGEDLAVTLRGFYSQGCLPGSLYDDAAYGTPNGNAIPFVLALQTFSVGFHHGAPGYEHCSISCSAILRDSDPYENQRQSTNLREIYSQLEAAYRAKADVLEFSVDVDLSQNLSIYSQTLYSKDQIYSTQDFNRFTTFPVFEDTSSLHPFGDAEAPGFYNHLMPGGIFCDPQLGCSDTIVGMDLSRAKSTQFSQEFRLQSNFDGPLNFSAGVGYTQYKTVEDYYVFFNGITLSAIVALTGGPGATFFQGPDILTPDKFTLNPDCTKIGLVPVCVPIETNPISDIQDTGHNYFLSRNPYRLKSGAVFGEVYWEATSDLKVTAGLRYTDDRKVFTPIPSETLLTGPEVFPYSPIPLEYIQQTHFAGTPLVGLGQGYPALPDVKRRWREVTGRIGVDWKPELAFTDQTMVYAFYSRGYKGGGMNPPGVGFNYEEAELAGVKYTPSAPVEFRPEFVNAFEVGAKNTLLSGGMSFNVTGFFYDYKDYQVSKIVDRSAANENFDAKVWGLEFETVFRLSEAWRFNANLGYLDTELAEDSRSIDVMNRTAGSPDWVMVKPAMTLMSNCIAPVWAVRQLANAFSASALCPGGGTFPPGVNYTGIPSGAPWGNGNFLPDGSTYDPRDYPEANFGAGFFSDVSGNELPNSPHWTFNIGGQYTRKFGESWQATVRSDFYWQSQSWARVYALPIDKLHAWKNANLSLLIERPDDALAFEIYAKNIFDDTPITDTFTNSDDTALTTNVFVLDPRLIGMSIKKGF